MSTAAAIGDAVVAALAGASLGISFTATRAYVVTRDLRELTALSGVQVTVLPASLVVTTMDTARRLAQDWGISIVVQSRVAADPASVDPLMTLVEAIARLFAAQTLGTAHPPFARCTGVENQPAYDEALLAEQGVFSSSLLLTFRHTS